MSECGVSAAWMRLPSPHGRVYGVPALWHRPANPRNASFCCCFGRCLKPLRVQGAALPTPPLLDLYVDHAVTNAGLQGVTRLHLVDAPHQRTIVAAGQDAVAAGYGGQRADCFQ